MKINIDCIREVLLELESFPIGAFVLSDFEKSIKKYGKENVLYSLVKLCEAEYINGTCDRSLDGVPQISFVFDITFSGHEFLEKIKSDNIWNTGVKPVLSKVGSKSFEAISQIAGCVISSLIASQFNPAP